MLTRKLFSSGYLRANPGIKILVEVTISKYQPDLRSSNLGVDANGEYLGVIPVSSVVDLLAEPFKPGDLVKYDEISRGKVVYVAPDGMVAVIWGDNSKGWWEPDKLERDFDVI